MANNAITGFFDGGREFLGKYPLFMTLFAVSATIQETATGWAVIVIDRRSVSTFLSRVSFIIVITITNLHPHPYNPGPRP
ncbi:hypothetical protein ACOMHN_052902 [Nucella lapillus]